MALRAQSQCLVQALSRVDFEAALQEHTAEQQLVQDLQEALQDLDLEELRMRLRFSDSFRETHRDFVATVCRGVDLAFFRPRAVVLVQGQECSLGESPCYFVLAGSASVEGSVGTALATLEAGEVFGHGGAFGLVEARTATVRASEGQLLCCARLAGEWAAKAIRSYPAEHQHLADEFCKFVATGAEAERQRREWLREVAVPALARNGLLVGCPQGFLQSLATALSERSYAAGTTIATVGQPLAAMLILLEGTAEVEAKSGAKVGRLLEGATFGDVGALGLFRACMATLRAACPCRVLAVPEEALLATLQTPGWEALARSFRCFVDARRQQVVRGLPLSAMDVGAGVEDVAARAVALLAERLSIRRGSLWQPLASSGPCGPCFAVLVQGRLAVEVGDNHESILTVLAGSYVPESLVAEHGACLRAETDCEAYRVRQSDFAVAVESSRSAQEWIWRFRMAERTAQEKMRSRLRSALGLLSGAGPHPRDNEIGAWTALQQRGRSQAGMRQEKDVLPLPRSRQEKDILPAVQLSPPPSSPTAGLSRCRSEPGPLPDVEGWGWMTGFPGSKVTQRRNKLLQGAAMALHRRASRGRSIL